MSRDSDPRSGLDDTIIVDEIGIESGGYGIYRLRSLYQPIYERRGKLLRAVAVEGTVAPYVAGEAAPREMFLAAVSADDRDFVERMELALPLRNHGNIGLDTLELVVGPEGSGPEALIDRVRLIGEELAEIGMEPSLVVCAFGEQAASDDALPSRLAGRRAAAACASRSAILAPVTGPTARSISSTLRSSESTAAGSRKSAATPPRSGCSMRWSRACTSANRKCWSPG